MRTVMGARMILVIAAIMAASPRPGHATTVCGTIITNMVSATMHSGPPDFVVFPTPGTAAPTFTAVVEVACPPAIHMAKFVNWPTASAGTTVVFRICIINETSDSVWGVTVTDRLPNGMLFRPMDQTWNDGVGAGSPYANGNTYQSLTPPDAGGWPPNPTIAWDTSENPAMNPGTPPDGQGPDMWLRWTVDYVGPMRSACLTYRAEVL